MDKRTLAIDCYIQALQKSVYLTEALDALVQHEILMAWEERDLLQHIMPNKQGNDADLHILKYLYEQKLKKYYSSSSQVDISLISHSYHLTMAHLFCRLLIQKRHQTTHNF
jgi:hypothetical protein